jgi:hypothetical protein
MCRSVPREPEGSNLTSRLSYLSAIFAACVISDHPIPKFWTLGAHSVAILNLTFETRRLRSPVELTPLRFHSTTTSSSLAATTRGSSFRSLSAGCSGSHVSPQPGPGRVVPQTPPAERGES